MQSKTEFLENVRYHAESLDSYTAQAGGDAISDYHRVDLDPELRAIFDECAHHQILMLDAAVRLAQACRTKLELVGGGECRCAPAVGSGGYRPQTPPKSKRDAHSNES